MRTLLVTITVFLATACSGVALAEIVVVTNPENGVTHLTREQVVNIYMGRYQGLTPDITAFPVDLRPLKGEFYRQLVDKKLSEINSYWARLVFSGRASPPRQVSDAAAVLEVVANNRGAIGYLRREEVDPGRAEIVYELDF